MPNVGGGKGVGLLQGRKARLLRLRMGKKRLARKWLTSVLLLGMLMELLLPLLLRLKRILYMLMMRLLKGMPLLLQR